MTMTCSRLGLLGCAALLVAAGCSGSAPEARVELQGAAGTKVAGSATFTQEGDAVHVVLHVKGLSPGEHGVHVHETGDCSAPDFSSAGGHFAPGGEPHGNPLQGPHHAGDLGNFTAGQDGSGTIDATFQGLTVADGPHSVVGRALIVHAGQDDLTTQPSGNSGARVACGVIGK
jgi:superoxide dismutase, Cu-Zn family